MTIPSGRMKSALRVIRFDPQRSEKQGLTARLVAPAVRLHRYKDRINVLKRARVFDLEYPALLGAAVLIENAEA